MFVHTKYFRRTSSSFSLHLREKSLPPYSFRNESPCFKKFTSSFSAHNAHSRTRPFSHHFRNHRHSPSSPFFLHSKMAVNTIFYSFSFSHFFRRQWHISPLSICPPLTSVSPSSFHASYAKGCPSYKSAITVFPSFSTTFESRVSLSLHEQWGLSTPHLSTNPLIP